MAGGAFDFPLRRHMGAIAVNMAEDAKLDGKLFQ